MEFWRLTGEDDLVINVLVHSVRERDCIIPLFAPFVFLDPARGTSSSEEDIMCVRKEIFLRS